LIPAVLAFAALIALGTWQIERKASKEGLIAALTARLAGPPVALPPPATWSTLDQASNEYRRVTFSAEFDNAKDALVYAAPSAFRPDASGPGFWCSPRRGSPTAASWSSTVDLCLRIYGIRPRGLTANFREASRSRE